MFAFKDLEDPDLLLIINYIRYFEGVGLLSQIVNSQ